VEKRETIVSGAEKKQKMDLFSAILEKKVLFQDIIYAALFK